uniref:Uncharacterized protein n=1 Tax=Triticum urartu TaxID=4572 RepID=A0A8R7V6B0_TRIUA
QGHEEESLGADPSFNSLTTESVGTSPDAQWDGAAAATQADDEAESGAPGSPSPPRPPPSISSRRDPLSAGCFRRLAASCEARRLREAALLRASKPPAEKAEDPDEPIWPPRSRHWRRFVELKTMGSRPANPVPNPDESSLSHIKSQDMLADKVLYLSRRHKNKIQERGRKVPKPPNCPRQSELIEPTEVPPPVHEDPVHNYMPVPHGEANPVTHIPVTLALQVSVMLSKKRKLNQ